MEKSIENLWKEGFIESDALIAPKVNNLYSRKSLHLIERYEKMFIRNVWGIIIGSSLLFIASYFAGALIAGSIIWLMMLYVAYTAYNEVKSLESIDKGQSSYIFLKSFKSWITISIDKYGRMYRIVYPVLILSFYFGIWYSDVFANIRDIVNEKSVNTIYGIHVWSTILVISAAIMMSIFSKTIHKNDVKAIYGRIIKKLDQALNEMEELRGR